MLKKMIIILFLISLLFILTGCTENKIKEKIERLPHCLTNEEVRGIKFFVNELLESEE